MNKVTVPVEKPHSPCFSSGPCKKYPGFSLTKLSSENLGRSHRAKKPKKMLAEVIKRCHQMLELPADYKIAITPASDTGAIEMALWSLLGAKPVNVMVWEQFSKDWLIDITQQLCLEDTNIFEADFGKLPDIKNINYQNDTVFVWNGTTSGVRLQNADFIPHNRDGLTICDATSAVFAQKIDFNKLDVTTFSWQKSLGGEAQHGMIILSPKALERLANYKPSWPIPKIFRLTKNNKIDMAIFEGATLNTPSMLCVDDLHKALDWADSIGGIKSLQKRADDNAKCLYDWLDDSQYLASLAVENQTRSNTSCCLKFTDKRLQAKSEADRQIFVKKFVQLLEYHDVAYDIASYRSAPAGLRIWTGPTIDKSDIVKLLPWLDWAWYESCQ